MNQRRNRFDHPRSALCALPSKTKTTGRVEAGRSVRSGSIGLALRPARRAAAVRAALVVALAAVDRLPAHRSEGNFGRHTTGVARDAHHLARAAFATVAVTGGFSFIAAVLATLRLVRESALCIKRLFIPAENELLAAVCAVEGLVVECVHETLIS